MVAACRVVHIDLGGNQFVAVRHSVFSLNRPVLMVKKAFGTCFMGAGSY